uniref:Uncharacterized protein n=1 Tax=Candidatus Kentrum sp. LPFa TaxID=2126335 RepID=A0A450WCH1_9GAMM|nr:MAG: hypothetical protein BECKLPF1236B_GA0070989_10652 [Candidatus Kentron sp. LPFa]
MTLIVPHTAEAKITADEIGADFVYLLNIWKLKPKMPVSCIDMEIGWLFRLMGVSKEQRLRAFHCFLGRATPLSHALTENWNDDDFSAWLMDLPEPITGFRGSEKDILEIDEAHSVISGFFRIHGIPVEHESDFARVARLAIGPTWIFCRYLRQLLHELTERAERERIARPVLDHDLIEAAWNDPEFQPLVEELLAPLSDAFLARLFLLLILYESMTLDARMQDSGIDTETILESLDDVLGNKKDFPQDNTDATLQTLVEHRFIRMSPEKDRISLVDGSVNVLLISQLGDRIDEYIDEYIKAAVKKVNGV